MPNTFPIQWKKNAFLFAALIAVAGFFAVVAQLYLIIVNRVTSIPETIVRFFSFYTILTNILIALCATSILMKRTSRMHLFFSRTSVLTALAVYIVVVGVVYNVVLRFLWDPQGLQYVVDELLHTVIPVLFVIFWIKEVPSANLPWRIIPKWLLYPLLYVIFILIRGEASGFYPYPFLEVIKIGYRETFLNIIFLLFFFCLVSAVFVIADRFAKNKKRRPPVPEPR